MNLIFVLLGLYYGAMGMWVLRRYPLLVVTCFMFAGSLALTAVFRHAPIDPTLGYDVFQDRMHSIFATAVGVSFSAFACVLAAIPLKQNVRISAAVMVVVAIVLPLMMFSVPEWKGLF